MPDAAFRPATPTTSWRARRLASIGVILTTAAIFAGCMSSSPRVSAPRDAPPNPYFAAPFRTTINATTFGQDPTWTPDGRVLSAEEDSGGTEQVFVSHLDGSASKCLTCGQPGPNGFPQERPQGDWILFCSSRHQAVTFGSPCLGGIGTDLYIMRPDGSHLTRLTMPGMPFEPAGTLYDNYHPYWAPDGRHLVWTHVSYVGEHQGGTQWTILEAELAPRGSQVPRLTDVTVVAPGGDNAYETQVWAPDGSGFLYTAFSSAGHMASGWLNSELYFMRLYGHGATPEHPLVTHMTDNSPAWDEQAVFTPDMKDVVWMSSRGSPTWYQTVVTAAQQVGFDPPMQNVTAGPFFVETILDPRFHTDLYELDLSTHAIRRLTDLHGVIPEFYFDDTGTHLLWSDGGNGPTNVGHFTLTTPPIRVGPVIRPVTMWTGAPRSGPIVRPRTVTRAENSPTFNARSVPQSIVAGLTLLQSQLDQLAARLSGLSHGPLCCGAPG